MLTEILEILLDIAHHGDVIGHLAAAWHVAAHRITGDTSAVDVLEEELDPSTILVLCRDEEK